MKRYIYTFILFTLTLHTAWADGGVSPNDAYKAMLQIRTYDSSNHVLSTGTACFVSENGEGVTSYQMLERAVRAEVIDFKGKTYTVYRILGANATTDLIKFSTNGTKNNAYFSITSASAQKYDRLQLVHYTGKKKEEPTNVNVSAVEDYNSYKYYHVGADNDSVNFGCPLINERGELTAFVQKNLEKGATTACAIDARFLTDMGINATSALSSDLRTLTIPKALPQNTMEALTYLYMLPSTDSTACLTAYEDFIQDHPDMPDGYSHRGAFYAQHKQYTAADADFRTAFTKARTCTDSLAVKEDALHYTLSGIIYRAAVNRTDSTAKAYGWTVERAENEADQAYAINSATLYIMQKGNCQFAARNFSGAAESFHKVCDDKSFASCETYYSYARSVELAGGDSLQVLALLDSCIAKTPQPVSAKYAQYYWERALRYERVGRFRNAVFDYNEYEKAIGHKNLSERFYFIREQAEIRAKMYQQALDDIRTAAAIAKQPLPYRLEEAYLLLQVGEYNDAIAAAENILKSQPDNPDCYKIIGLSKGELGQKSAALQYLKKAQQLGDESAEGFMQRYK